MSIKDYHKTTTQELMSLTNKVRMLVNHWGEDGRYKEAVLKNIIKRFLPEKYIIGTGFVIKQVEEFDQHESSKQIDLIIYENSSPVLFKEGDFVILTPDAVAGIIEVKANLLNQDTATVIKQANENGEFIFSGKTDKTKTLFNGIFSFESRSRMDVERLKEKFILGDFLHTDNSKKFKVNHIAFDKDWFLKYWPDDMNEQHSIYNITDLAFPFFISNLIDLVGKGSVERNPKIWFSTDKELNLVKKF